MTQKHYITIAVCSLLCLISIFMFNHYYQEYVNINVFRYRIKNKNNSSKVKVLPKLFSSFNKISPNPSNKKENFIVGRICTKDIFDNQTHSQDPPANGRPSGLLHSCCRA